MRHAGGFRRPIDITLLEPALIGRNDPHVGALSNLNLRVQYAVRTCPNQSGGVSQHELRLAAEHPERFSGLVVANTGLPTGDIPMPEIWWQFRKAIQSAPSIDVGRFVQGGCRRPMSDEVRAGYDSPFPDDTYCAGPRAMPGLLPTSPDDPAAPANRSAWAKLCASSTPMLVAFSDGDPITGGMAPIFQRKIPGAQGIEHPVVRDAGHFLQEDAGKDLAAYIVDFLRS